MGGIPALAILLSVAMAARALAPSSPLSAVEKQRLKKVFTDSLGKAELTSVAYSIMGQKLLGESAPVNAKQLCQDLQRFADAKDASVGDIHQAAAAAKDLTGCQLKLGKGASEALSAALSSGGSTVGDLYHAAFAHLSLGLAVDKAAVGKLLSAALEKDDSVSNLGYAFNLAAALGADAAKTVFERVEDAVVQADEVDGRVLQFEGGLTVTHLVVEGAYRLAEKVGKAPPITKSQAVKFADYFLGRKSVQQPKAACLLLRSLSTLSAGGNAFHVPVSVTLGSSASVSASSPSVRVRVTDILGRSLGKMAVRLETAKRIADGAVVASKAEMKPIDGDDLYEVNLFEAAAASSKPGRGFYELAVRATPEKPDEKLVGNDAAVLTVKVLSEVSVEEVEFGTGDADQSVAPKMRAVKHPAKMAEVLRADHHQKIVLKFALVDKASGGKVRLHQVFVTLAHAVTGSEIVFVAEAEGAAAEEANYYRFELDVGAKSKDFGGASGKYNVKLTVGDAVVSNPMSWHLADVELAFAAASAQPPPPQQQAGEGKPKPEIRHLFREPEKRPAAVISNSFTALCLAPFALLFVGWAMLGVNVSNLPLSVSTLGFHLGLGAIFGLYYWFWLSLDMFTTIKYLFMVGIVTFLCGNSLLSKVAEKRKAAA